MHDSPAGAPGLLDRVRERGVLEQLVADVRSGRSHVLVLRGEAGVGKTALLRHVPTTTDGCQIAWATGVENEMELAFAGLHSLCTPWLDRLGVLPEPQREALSTAFGLSSGPPPERFLVGLAVLSLLADVAEEQPVVCIVDDAQWLDQVSSQTLAFVARRLLAERVGFVFSVRGLGADDTFTGLPELLVEGLATDDARQLLDLTIPGVLDEQVKARILDETRGNPLALMQLPRGLTPAELAGGFGLTNTRPLTSRIEQSFLQQVRALPRDTQLLLLTAAAEPLGDVSLLWRAAEFLGIGAEAAQPAEADGLIEFGTRVRFPHPLVRSAIYRASDPRDRVDVRHALADATDPVLDPDRRAWHRAHATTMPDETVAEAMVRSADRARARGGLAATAAFLQRATELTPDPATRADRALAAAHAKLDVADTSAAAELLAAAELGPADDVRRAHVERLRAEIEFTTFRGRDAPRLLMQAAQRLEPFDGALARETYLEAIASAMFAGRLGTGPDARVVAEAARHCSRASDARGIDQLLDGLVKRYTEGYAASTAPLRRALRSLADTDGDDENARWLWLACRFAQDLWDDDLWLRLATSGERIARETGALGQLANALNYRAAFNVHAGTFSAAALLIDQVDVITEATGLPPLKFATLLLATSRGDRPQMQQFPDIWLKNVAARGEGSAIGQYQALTARMHNGAGQYGKARTAALESCEYDDVVSYGWALAELVEAAARDGQLDEAAGALDRLTERTQAAGTEWALGVEARCRGLVRDDDASYRESIERLEQSHAALDLARTQLVYGEWLRRQNQRTEAREVLRTAHDSLGRMGSDAFAERARRELLATGETARRRTADTRDDLTPQELQVAKLASEGLTNPEIAAQLFISARTVEYHLGKVFAKVGVKNRRALRDVFADAAL